MSHFLSLSGTDPIAAWRAVVQTVARNGERQGGIIELTHLTVTVEGHSPLTDRQVGYYRKLAGEAAWERMKSVYSRTSRLPWKPSYIGRLVDWKLPVGHIDQLSEVRKKAARTPGSKTLCCTVFNPVDLRRYISASVPCLVALDFKIRKGRIHTAAFFRSQDVFRFFPGDYHHISLISMEVAASLSSSTEYQSGSLVLHLCSAHFKTSIRKTTAFSRLMKPLHPTLP